MFRAVVARANFMAQDRSDVQFAVSELCRKMSSPDVNYLSALKRFARYLVMHPRVVQEFKYQEAIDVITTWTDTDYAGCKLTRKSTSGGVVMLGESCNQVVQRYSK